MNSAAPSAAFGFDTPFFEQIEFFRNKLNLPSERWDDIKKAAHDRAFIVAGVMKADLLSDLNGAVDNAIAGGGGQEAFNKSFSAIVQKHGWHGWTGEGSPGGEAWRMRVIFETNLLTSRAAGRYRQLTDPDLLSRRPFWRYVHNDSTMHPRPHHLHWGNIRLTLRYDHPFWIYYFPPNGWGCGCWVVAVAGPQDGDATEPPIGWDQQDSRGNLPGIDKGFDYTPGRSVTDELRALVDAKVAKLPEPLAQALRKEVSSILGDGSPSLRDQVISISNEIASESLENLVVLNADGAELLRKIGSADSVALKASDLALLPNNILLHNHPGNFPEGFSVDDVRLALWHDMAQMHAVDTFYLYSLERPQGVRWGADYWAGVEPVWARVTKDVAERLRLAREQGKISADELLVLQEHMTCLEVDNEISIGYSRTLRKDLAP